MSTDLIWLLFKGLLRITQYSIIDKKCQNTLTARVLEKGRRPFDIIMRVFTIPLILVNCESHLYDFSLGPVGRLFVSLFADDDGPSVSGHNLLEGVHTLGVHWVPHHDQQDGNGFVHHGQRTVLQLTRLDALTEN